MGNFTITELCNSTVAKQKGIKNVPQDLATMDNMLNLITDCLQPLRNKLGRPIIITSGFRNDTVNKLVGGKANSQHRYGQAVDCHVNGMSIPALIQFVVKSGVEYDQVIDEYGQWLHISYVKGKNRKQPPFKIS